MTIEILLYQKQNGKKPFEEWFEKLKDKKVKEIIKSRIERVRIGNFGDFKNITKDIFEIRFKVGFRVYFAKIDKKTILLLCGGNKSSQLKDIEKSKIYWSEFREEL